MTVLTIEIPDNKTEDIVKYLKENEVVIKETLPKSIDDLTEDDYRAFTKERALKMRTVALKYL